MRIIRSLVFDEGGGVQVTFLEDSDIRLEGRVFMTKTMTVAGGQHETEVQELQDYAQDFLRDVYQDWAQSQPFDIEGALRANERE